jgi:hypothetical protein
MSQILKPEAVALLQSVRTRILNQPDTFDMYDFLEIYDTRGKSLSSVFDIHTVEEKEICKTVCCFAGWIVLEGVPREEFGNTVKAILDGDPTTLAAERLGVSTADCRDLFFLGDWPINYRHAYQKADRNPGERARIAADRLAYWIETDTTDGSLRSSLRLQAYEG